MVQEITFAQWLKSRRRVLDLSQQALADQVSCSAEMIYRIEAGQRRPSAQTARLLRKVLHVPAAEEETFVRFARAEKPTKIHTHQVEITPWRDAFIPSSNLPLQLTALIGRERALAEAANRLRQDEVRLLTITGPPGIGKTRFAVQLGNDVLLDYPDGVYWVDLASIHNPDLVIPAIARSLGISLAGHRKPTESLHASLYERNLLLILDNFEQVQAAAPDVHALLVACPLVNVIVTSRAPLRVRGERQFPLEPLALPGRIDDMSLHGLAGFSAVQLFLERAKAVRPDFELTAENAPFIAAICAQLDGLPLALEIVAAQVALFQPEEILSRLTGSHLLDSQGMVDGDRRHQSLNTAIRWSVQLLSEHELAFFRRLGVFADGCTLEAAQSVCQPEQDIVPMLARLVSMNLLRRETVTHESSRYRMLEVIRQYAQRELHTTGEWQLLQERHAACFHAFARAHEAIVRSDGQSAGLALVEREHANLLAALDYLIAAGAAHQALELVGALIEFWVYRNHILVGLRYTTTLLGLAESDQTVEYARALNGAAILSYFAGDFPVIGTFAEKALTLAQQIGSARDIAWATTTLGMQNGGMGNFEAATRYFEQGLRAVEGQDLPWEIASLLNGLGEVSRSQGHFDEAMTCYSRALTLSDGMGNRWLSAHILDNMGHAAFSQGQFDIANEYIRRSMEASIVLGDERGIAMCLEKLGGIALAQERPELAARLLGSAEALREARNTPIEGMDSADYQRVVAQLRDQLPAEQLEAHWNAGRDAPLSEIIEQIAGDY